MQRERLDARLHQIALWSTIMIPVACAFSRALADILLIISAIMFLLHTAVSRDVSWLKEWWVRLALILWAYLVARGCFAEDPSSAVGRAAAWLRFPMFAIAASHWILRSDGAFKKLIISLSISVGFMLVDTAIQYVMGVDLLGREPYPSHGSPRLTGPFTAPRIGIMLIWMGIPVLAYWLMKEGGTLRKGRALALGIAYTLGLATVIFVTGERMAFLLTGLAFVLAFFILPISKKLMLALGVSAALLVGLLAHLNPGLVQRQMDSTEGVINEFSGSQYGQIWHSGFEMFKAHPIFGVGLKQFRYLCPNEAYGPIELVETRCNLHPHNVYLEWAVEAGSIGIIMIVAILVLIVRKLAHHHHALKTNPVFLGLLITLLIRLWPLASTTSFFTAWSAVPFWLVIGWLLAFVAHYGKEK